MSNTMDLTTVPTDLLVAEVKRRYDGKPMRALTVCNSCGHAQDKPINPDGSLVNNKCRRCEREECQIATAEQLAESTGLAAYARIGL